MLPAAADFEESEHVHPQLNAVCNTLARLSSLQNFAGSVSATHFASGCISNEGGGLDINARSAGVRASSSNQPL